MTHQMHLRSACHAPLVTRHSSMSPDFHRHGFRGQSVAADIRHDPSTWKGGSMRPAAGGIEPPQPRTVLTITPRRHIFP